MKYILPTALMLFSIAVLATGGGAQSNRPAMEKDTKNSEGRMEERQNNSSVLMGSGSGIDSAGKDTSARDMRPQGKDHNNAYSDTDLSPDDE
jgi:hypothetical protein